MARTAVSYSTLTPNALTADPAGTAVTSGAGNGGQVASAIPEQTVIRVANASGSNAVITVKAGANPPAIGAPLGDYVSGNVATATSAFLGPFESGRFLQSDGSLIVESSQNVTMTAFKVPRNA